MIQIVQCKYEYFATNILFFRTSILDSLYRKQITDRQTYTSFPYQQRQTQRTLASNYFSDVNILIYFSLSPFLQSTRKKCWRQGRKTTKSHKHTSNLETLILILWIFKLMLYYYNSFLLLLLSQTILFWLVFQIWIFPTANLFPFLSSLHSLFLWPTTNPT